VHRNAGKKQRGGEGEKLFHGVNIVEDMLRTTFG